MASGQPAGGFLRPTLPSPPPSVASTAASPLPQPRTRPLKAGSPKEAAFVDYVDSKLLEVSSRYERRSHEAFIKGKNNQPCAQLGSKVDRGYVDFAGIATDLEKLVDVVWVSGSPSLQIPFLLNIALAVTTYLPSFPFSPQPTFQLLQKLDYVFSSLIQGTDLETGSKLPGYESGKRVTMTEKVRLRGIVERTRVQVVEIAGKGSNIDEGSESTGTFTETDDTNTEGPDDEDGLEIWEMPLARIYERTIVDLGPVFDIVTAPFERT